MSEICKRCGGCKSATFAVTTVNHIAIRPIDPCATTLVCFCPPEKHGGKLNEEDTHHVYYNNFGGIGIGVGSDGVGLDAKEALELLTWLKQEEQELKRLAKEATL